MIIAAIVAGGSGMRMGGELPKQFLELCGKPVIIRTVESFLKHPLVDAVVIGIHPDYYDYTLGLIEQYLPGSPVYLVNGGSSRNETIENSADGEHAIEVSGEEAEYSNTGVTKTGDSDGDEADFYGENSAIFATASFSDARRASAFRRSSMFLRISALSS